MPLETHFQWGDSQIASYKCLQCVQNGVLGEKRGHRWDIGGYWVCVGPVKEDFSAVVASKIEKQRRVGQLNERSQSVCEENFQAKMELPGSMYWVDKVTRQKISKQKLVMQLQSESDSLGPHGLHSVVHGILQARILEWVVVPFSRRLSQPRDQTQVSHIVGRFFTSLVTREAPVIVRSR